MRVGIDVGGTNTDAVLLDGDKVVASYKAPTSQNIREGIVNAMQHILEGVEQAESQISSIVIGTTQFTNAFVERKQLVPVGVIRLGLPSTTAIPPLTGWPEGLVEAIGHHAYVVPGGYEFDGRQLSEYDPAAIDQAIGDFKSKGINAIAISSVFSPLNGQMEQQVAEQVLAAIPDANITMSHQIGRLGLLERENAVIMNAALSEFADRVVASFGHALKSLNLQIPFYISQNDGTLLDAEAVKAFPILTFSSGPTNSMRGAAFLSQKTDAIVVDIGGTTTDVGVLINGYPRESSMVVDIGGVRTNFRMPDVYAAGLGGGSYIRQQDDGSLKIGPDSVGYKLLTEAKVFGGDTLTTTDIAVAAGKKAIGDPHYVKDLDPALVDKAHQAIHSIVADAIDRMKTSASSVPVILVGGGSALISEALPGVSELVVPEHAAVANAIGAAIAQVGGETDRVYSYNQQSRESAIASAKQEAIDDAIHHGAEPESINIIDIEELPLAYLSGDAIRIKVKCVGDLATVKKDNKVVQQ